MSITAFAVLTALISAWAFTHLADTQGSAVWWIGLVSIILFLSCFVIQTVVNTYENKRFVLISIILETAAFAWPLYRYRSFWFFIFAVIAFLFFMLADRRGRELLHELTKIRFFIVLRAILPAAVTAVSIFGVMFFYESGGGLKPGLVNASVSASFRPVEPILSRFFGGVSLEQPIQEFLKNLAANKFGEQTPAERDKAAQGALEQIQNTLAQSFHITIGPSDRVTDIIERVTREAIVGLSKTTFGIIAVAMILFFIVRSIGAILSWVVSIVAWGIFKLLLVFRFCKVTLESCEQERLVL